MNIVVAGLKPATIDFNFQLVQLKVYPTEINQMSWTPAIAGAKSFHHYLGIFQLEYPLVKATFGFNLFIDDYFWNFTIRKQTIYMPEILLFHFPGVF
jgi:hypothetical protein